MLILPSVLVLLMVVTSLWLRPRDRAAAWILPAVSIAAVCAGIAVGTVALRMPRADQLRLTCSLLAFATPLVALMLDKWLYIDVIAHVCRGPRVPTMRPIMIQGRRSGLARLGLTLVHVLGWLAIVGLLYGLYLVNSL